MAMTAIECQQMIDTAKAHDRKLVIGFQWRLHPKTQFLKRAPKKACWAMCCTGGCRHCAGEAFPTGACSAARIFKAVGR